MLRQGEQPQPRRPPHGAERDHRAGRAIGRREEQHGAEPHEASDAEPGVHGGEPLLRKQAGAAHGLEHEGGECHGSQSRERGGLIQASALQAGCVEAQDRPGQRRQPERQEHARRAAPPQRSPVEDPGRLPRRRAIDRRQPGGDPQRKRHAQQVIEEERKADRDVVGVGRGARPEQRRHHRLPQKREALRHHGERDHAQPRRPPSHAVFSSSRHATAPAAAAAPAVYWNPACTSWYSQSEHSSRLARCQPRSEYR